MSRTVFVLPPRHHMALLCARRVHGYYLGKKKGAEQRNTRVVRCGVEEKCALYSLGAREPRGSEK